MPKTSYDESSRYLAGQAGAAMMHWLPELDATHIGFNSWLNPVLTWPGMKERVCDAVARMVDLDRGGLPCAAIVEFQTEPDPNMFGRLLVAGGLCWLTVKPADLPGDRFELSAVVVNLTGEGDCARHMILGTTEWKLTPRELNLGTLDAALVLEQIAAGKIPREVLAWIPVMKIVDEAAIIRRWEEIVSQEEDLARRGNYALASVFAEAVGRQQAWRKAVEELKMTEPQIVLDWIAKGERKGKAEMLLLVLQGLFPSLPDDLVSRVRASTDNDQLERWAKSAAKAAAAATTLEEFRRQAGL
jgi:hypothetical protein